MVCFAGKFLSKEVYVVVTWSNKIMYTFTSLHNNFYFGLGDHDIFKVTGESSTTKDTIFLF